LGYFISTSWATRTDSHRGRPETELLKLRNSGCNQKSTSYISYFY
jgi:hypothetical protein